MFNGTYRNLNVLVTGHTGFKGSWLCEWLLLLGANVAGYSLAPPSQPALFEALGLGARMRDVRGDVRDPAGLALVIRESKPRLILHLAAQSLVRASYSDPVGTFDTNVLGTVNVLEAVRLAGQSCAVVIVTTDKCYENREWIHSYREEDPMGGYDPYSASKGCAEIVTASYRRSFFPSDSSVLVASARAGNVLGGGDWAQDRILPDCIRHLALGHSIPVRNKHATRPWQHVLEPLSGYLLIGGRLVAQLGLPPSERAQAQHAMCAGAFNFGPSLDSNRSVADLVQEVLKHWPGRWDDQSSPTSPHEASLLNLATDKARHLLKWKPIWSFEETVCQTVSWYRTMHANPAGSAGDLTRSQIQAYATAAGDRQVIWVR